MIKKLLVLYSLSAVCTPTIQADSILQQQLVNATDVLQANNQFISGFAALGDNKNMTIANNASVIGFVLSFNHSNKISKIFVGKNATHFTEIDDSSFKKLDHGIIEASLSDIDSKTIAVSSWKVANIISLLTNFGCDLLSNNEHKTTDNIINAFAAHNSFEQKQKDQLSFIQSFISASTNDRTKEITKFRDNKYNLILEFFATLCLISTNKAIHNNQTDYLNIFQAEYSQHSAFVESQSYNFNLASLKLNFYGALLHHSIEYLDFKPPHIHFTSQKTISFAQLIDKLGFTSEESSYIKNNIFDKENIVAAGDALTLKHIIERFLFFLYYDLIHFHLILPKTVLAS